MAGFPADWLRLREPADHAARDNAVTHAVVAWAGARESTGLNVLDLGAGTGSNLRFLAPQLGHGQHWHLIDHDPTLLENQVELLENWVAENDYRWVARGDENNATLELKADHFSVRIDRELADLSEGIDGWLHEGVDLVTGSALLDLVSETWIDQLVASCARQRCAICFALTYDGQVTWQPVLEGDQLLQDQLNAHQQQDKGLGLALGPAAADALIARLSHAGYGVQHTSSPWQLDAARAPLQRELATGWAEAVQQQDPALGATAQLWLKARRALADQPATLVTVGHVDVLGLPPQ